MLCVFVFISHAHADFDSGAKGKGKTDKIGKLKFKGKVEMEYVSTEDSANTNEPNAYVGLDKIRLEPEVQVSESVRFEADVDFDETSVKVDEFYFEFSDLPLGGTLVVGKEDRFFRVDRITERHPLVANAFARDEEIGLHWRSDLGSLDVYGMITQGLELNNNGSGEDDSYDILHDNTLTSAYGGNVHFAVGAGQTLKFSDSSKFKFLVFAYVGKLSAADITFLQTNFAGSGYTSNEDVKLRLGTNLNLDLGPLGLDGQFIWGKDGDFKRAGAFLQANYRFWKKSKTESFRSLRAILRWGFLNPSITPDPTEPMSWDRSEITVAAILGLVQDLDLKAEYTIESESGTGVTEVSNNELVIQLNYEF